MEEMKEASKEEMKVGKQRNGKKKWLILILLLILLGSFAAWKLFDTGDGLAMDPDQSEGTLDGLSEAEIQKLLDDKVAEGSVQINMNSKLVFKDGKAKGYVRIVNSPNNHYKLVVEMIRKDTSETIYQTGAMDPGNYLEQDRLDVDLPKGDYPVSIHFRNYDRKSEQFVGEAVTENVVHILN